MVEVGKMGDLLIVDMTAPASDNGGSAVVGNRVRLTRLT